MENRIRILLRFRTETMHGLTSVTAIVHALEEPEMKLS